MDEECEDEDDVRYDPFHEHQDVWSEDVLQRFEDGVKKAEWSDLEKRIWLQRIRSYRLLLEHRVLNEKVNNRFAEQLRNLRNHELLFLMDYKQNVVINHQPEEENWVFRY